MTALPPRAPQPHDLVLRAMRRHPFFLGSLAVHGAVLWMLSHLHGQTLTQATLRSNQAQIQVHTQAAEQRGMRRRVDSLKAMKSLMERVERAQSGTDDADQASSDAAPAPGPSATPAQTPQDMLAQARELRDSIQRIEQAAQAKKMAEVLNLPPEQALQQVMQQAAAEARKDAAADAIAPQNNEQVVQALDRYEQQAREALQRLQAQRAQERQGTPTQMDTSAGQAHAADGGQGSDAGEGASRGGGAPGAAAAQGGRSGTTGTGSNAANGATGRPDGRQTSVNDTLFRRYDGQQQAPVVNTNQLRLGAGNSFGPQGVWANRVFVDRWYLIGPFDAPNASSMQKIYPPEQWVDLDGVYLGKGQRVLRWQYVSSAAYPLTPPDYAEQAIYYGHTEIVSDRARSVWMAVGADDDAKMWVNDQLVWTSGNQRKAWYTDGGVKSLKQDIQARNLIEERLRVHLRKGRNTVLFKLYNSPLDVFFSLVIEPVEGGG